MRAFKANRVAWTGTGNVIVASMLWDSALRKVRDVVTTARQPSIRTSNRVATRGTGRCVPATKPPAMKAWSGSILVCGAIKLMGAFPHQVRQQGCDSLDQRVDVGTAAEQIRVDDKRDAGGHRKRRALASFEQQLDGCRREAEIAQPGVAPDRLNVLVAIVGVGAASARRRNEVLGNQIADLPLGYSGECRKLANFHGSTFRQKYCRKIVRLSTFFTKLLSKSWAAS